MNPSLQHLARLARSLARVGTAPDRLPIVGRRCLRSDLDQREILLALAARKAHRVGTAQPHAAQAGGIPVKRGRRFALAQG